MSVPSPDTAIRPFGLVLAEPCTATEPTAAVVHDVLGPPSPCRGARIAHNATTPTHHACGFRLNIHVSPVRTLRFSNDEKLQRKGALLGGALRVTLTCAHPV